MDIPKISFSMRSSFRRCSRQVFYNYVAGVRSVSEDNPARAIGRAFHAILERTRKGEALQDCLKSIQDDLVSDLSNQLMQPKDIYVAVTKLEAYALGYEQYFGKQGDADWEPELELSTQTEKGILDAVYITNGLVWVVEDKTTSELSMYLPAALKMNEQLLTYASLLLDGGYQLGGFLYRQTLKSKCSMKKDETSAEFRDRIISIYKEENETKYRQISVTFTAEEIHEYKIERMLLNTIITNTFKLPKEPRFWPRNTDNCIGLYGLCDFYKLCTKSNGYKSCYQSNGKTPMDGGAFVKNVLGE